MYSGDIIAVRKYTVQVVLHPISISMLCPWGSFWEQGRQVECTCQTQGRGWCASNCPGSARGSKWLSPIASLSSSAAMCFSFLALAAPMVSSVVCEHNGALPWLWAQNVLLETRDLVATFLWPSLHGCACSMPPAACICVHTAHQP